MKSIRYDFSPVGPDSEHEIQIEGAQVRCVKEGTCFFKVTVPMTEEGVLDAIWAAFADPQNPYSLLAQHLCVLQSSLITIYSPTGDVYSVPLPFTARAIWPMMEGVLIERALDHSRIPIMFTLLHPLEHLKPVDSISSGCNKSVSLDEFVVFLSNVQPVLVTYNSRSYHYQVYIIRQSQSEIEKRKQNSSALDPSESVIATPSRQSLSSSPYAMLLSRSASPSPITKMSENDVPYVQTSEIRLESLFTLPFQPTPCSVFLASDIDHNLLLCIALKPHRLVALRFSSIRDTFTVSFAFEIGNVLSATCIRSTRPLPSTQLVSLVQAPSLFLKKRSEWNECWHERFCYPFHNDIVLVRPRSTSLWIYCGVEPIKELFISSNVLSDISNGAVGYIVEEFTSTIVSPPPNNIFSKIECTIKPIENKEPFRQRLSFSNGNESMDISIENYVDIKTPIPRSKILPLQSPFVSVRAKPPINSVDRNTSLLEFSRSSFEPLSPSTFSKEFGKDQFESSNTPISKSDAPLLQLNDVSNSISNRITIHVFSNTKVVKVRFLIPSLFRHINGFSAPVLNLNPYLLPNMRSSVSFLVSSIWKTIFFSLSGYCCVSLMKDFATIFANASEDFVFAKPQLNSNLTDSDVFWKFLHQNLDCKDSCSKSFSLLCSLLIVLLCKSSVLLLCNQKKNHNSKWNNLLNSKFQSAVLSNKFGTLHKSESSNLTFTECKINTLLSDSECATLFEALHLLHESMLINPSLKNQRLALAALLIRLGYILPNSKNYCAYYIRQYGIDNLYWNANCLNEDAVLSVEAWVSAVVTNKYSSIFHPMLSSEMNSPFDQLRKLSNFYSILFFSSESEAKSHLTTPLAHSVSTNFFPLFSPNSSFVKPPQLLSPMSLQLTTDVARDSMLDDDDKSYSFKCLKLLNRLCKENVSLFELQNYFETIYSHPILQALWHLRNIDHLYLNELSGPELELLNRKDLSKLLVTSAEFSSIGKNVSPYYVSKFSGGLEIYSKLPEIADSRPKQDAINNPMYSDLDGFSLVEEQSKMRFTKDKRLKEVFSMFRSSSPVAVEIQSLEELSNLPDHEVAHYNQRLLLLYIMRQWSTCIARGMITLYSVLPIMTEKLSVPPISSSGLFPSKVTPLSLDLSSTSPFYVSHPHIMNENLDPLFEKSEGKDGLISWPSYHNGVAAALRVNSYAPQISRSWIVYHRPSSPSFEHAGLLLGLGISGHLKSLTPADIIWYLSQKHIPTTISLLIGLACSRRATMDTTVSRMLCCHLPILNANPINSFTATGFTAVDLEIPVDVQSAALIGLGMLYQQSSHRLIVQMCLFELTKRITMDSHKKRESIVVSAGLALGMICLGLGDDTVSLQDLKIVDNLTKLIHGDKNPFNPSSRDSFNSKPRDSELLDTLRASFIFSDSKNLASLLPTDVIWPPHISQVSAENGVYHPVFPSMVPPSSVSNASCVLESKSVNTNLTAPGAMCALGLMFCQKNNKAIADILSLPSNACKLDNSSSELYILRILCRSLIMWSETKPTLDFICNQIPAPVLLSISVELDKISTRNSSVKNSTDHSILLERSSYFQKLSSKDHNNCINESSNTWRDENMNTMTDATSARQIYCNVVAGSLLAIGFKFAGTANEQAKSLLCSHLIRFHYMRPNSQVGVTVNAVNSSNAASGYTQPAGTCNLGFDSTIPPLLNSSQKIDRATVENGLNCISFALGLVMAGSGDLESYLILRHIWKYLEHDVSFSSHASISMSIGLLFLGGSRLSLSNNPQSVAALLCSFYPYWTATCITSSCTPTQPLTTSDQSAHLQPLRHLYALAVCPQYLCPVDVNTEQNCVVDIEIYMKQDYVSNNNSRLVYLTAPCLLPPLDNIETVRICSPDHYPLSLSSHSLKKVLTSPILRGNLYIQRKPASLLRMINNISTSSRVSNLLSHVLTKVLALNKASSKFKEVLMSLQDNLSTKKYYTSSSIYSVDNLLLNPHDEIYSNVVYLTSYIRTFIRYLILPLSNTEGESSELACFKNDFFGALLLSCMSNNSIEFIPLMLDLFEAIHNNNRNTGNQKWLSILVAYYDNINARWSDQSVPVPREYFKSLLRFSKNQQASNAKILPELDVSRNMFSTRMTKI